MGPCKWQGNNDSVEVLRNHATSLIRMFSCHKSGSPCKKIYNYAPFGWDPNLRFLNVCNEDPRPKQRELKIFITELKRVIAQYSVLYFDEDMSNISDIKIAEPNIDQRLYAKNTINLVLQKRENSMMIDNEFHILKEKISLNVNQSNGGSVQVTMETIGKKNKFNLNVFIFY